MTVARAGRTWYAIAVSGDPVIVEPGHHVAGEYAFTPDTLTLSIYCGPPLVLEQAGDGSRWHGTVWRGDVKVMVPGEERLFRHRREAAFTCLTLVGSGADAACRPGSPRPRMLLRDGALAHVIEALSHEQAAGPTSRLFRDAVADAILARLLALEACVERPSAPGLSRTTLARVVDYLHAHLADDLSIADLARVAGMRSAAHFSTRFRQSTGEPPHRFHTRLRVDRARQLLERGVDPAAAAVEVGFYDQSHLARHTRRLLGVPPGALHRPRRPRG